jgi:hypothetical protein
MGATSGRSEILNGVARVWSLAALVAVTAAGGWGGAVSHLERRPNQEPAVTIAEPGPGLVTSARTIDVRGRAPWIAPDAGESIVRVTVNGRPSETFPTRQGYSTPIALELGRNEIVVRGRSEPFDDGKAVTGTARIVVQRRRVTGDDTGVLDRATAFMLADSTTKAYWLCGEDDQCSHDPVCFSIGPRRVDCAVAYWYVDNPMRRCGHVDTLRLHGNRLYSGSYACSGRLNPRPRQRLIQDDAAPALTRVVIDADEENRDLFRVESNRSNRYGAPRFSMARDVFLP